MNKIPKPPQIVFMRKEEMYDDDLRNVVNKFISHAYRIGFAEGAMWAVEPKETDE